MAVAEWLFATGRLTAESVPVATSAHGYVVSDRPEHPTGNAFSRHKTLSNCLVVFTGVSSVRPLVKLLQHCGVGADAVWLQSSPTAGG